MKASYVLDLEKKIEALRINVAREWAIERGMRGIEDMTNEDWGCNLYIASYQIKI